MKKSSLISYTPFVEGIITFVYLILLMIVKIINLGWLRTPGSHGGTGGW